MLPFKSFLDDFSREAKKKVKSLNTQKESLSNKKKVCDSHFFIDDDGISGRKEEKGTPCDRNKKGLSFIPLYFSRRMRESEKEKIIMVHNRCPTTTTNTPSWCCDDIWEADKKRIRYYFFI